MFISAEGNFIDYFQYWSYGLLILVALFLFRFFMGDPAFSLLSSSKYCGQFDNQKYFYLKFEDKCVFIRDCYDRLIVHIYSTLLADRRTKKILILGIPGIGKSNFLLYFMWKIAHPNNSHWYGRIWDFIISCITIFPSFVYCNHTGDGSKYFLVWRNGYCCRSSDETCGRFLCNFPSMWLIVDGKDEYLSNSPYAKYPTLLASSLDDKNTNEYAKWSRRLCMPAWDRGDYKDVHYRENDRDKAYSMPRELVFLHHLCFPKLILLVLYNCILSGVLFHARYSNELLLVTNSKLFGTLRYCPVMSSYLKKRLHITGI